MKFETQSRKNKKALDKDLNKALREVEQKKVIGPFSSIKELKKSLEIRIRRHK